MLVLMLLGSACLHAATVRGRLVVKTPQGQKPAPGISVTVYSQQQGRKPASISSSEGMYYIPSVPAGTYTLEVWVDPKKAMTFTISVTEPNTDVPPIIVP